MELKIGMTVRVPSRTGRGYWWMDIIDMTADGRFLKVSATPERGIGKGQCAAGPARWVLAKACTSTKREYRKGYRSNFTYKPINPKAP